MIVSVLQAASPLAPGDKYPQHHKQQYHQNHPVPQQSQDLSNRRALLPNYYRINSIEEDIITEDSLNPDTRRVMTGNGLFITSSPGSGLMKSKSGSLPDRYSARGFRDTFVSSMTPPTMSNSATSSPHHNQSRSDMNSPAKDSIGKESAQSGGGGSSVNKKWTFGGLFKRKSKSNTSQSPSVLGSPSLISRGSSMSASPSPALTSGILNNGAVSFTPQSGSTVGLGGSEIEGKISGNVSTNSTKYISTPTQTRQKGKLSESDLSSEDSEELENESWSRPNEPEQQHQPLSFKQNFLTRRLSRRREKAAAKKKAAEIQTQNGFLKVPLSGQLNNGKRVGSSPDSLNNGNNLFGFGTNNAPFPSWETTKKVPQLQAPNNNYSSSGSLSLSYEGSTKGSRAAMKEAVKARAVARRESIFRDTSSEDDGEDVSRSSIQGSHSSLSSRNRRRPLVNGNVNGSLNNGNGNSPLPLQKQGHAFRPSEFSRGSPSSPAKFDYQNNNPSPNLNRRLVAPGSPRWEARVVYTQENVENETPFVVKLPKSQPNQVNLSKRQENLGSLGYNIMSREPTPENQQLQQQVITAGLRVPISEQAQIPNGQYFTEEVHYANLPNGVNNNNNMRQRSATPQNYPSGYNNINPSPPPPPPRRDFNRQQNVLFKSQTNPNFYRPVSCSYLDAYEGFCTQRNASPNPNVMSFTPVNMNAPNTRHYNYNQPPHQMIQSHQQQIMNGNYYHPEQDQMDNSSRQLLKNNNFLNPNHYTNKHIYLIRSPSEPPEIKIQHVREQSPLKRNASTPSPAPHYNNQDKFIGNSNEVGSNSKIHQPVIMSKLGFPVRRLHEANKILPAQSPVHMRASEFWRKKEAEVTGNPVQPNPNHKKYMNRIRSADSSPLPIPRMRNSPAGIQNSNESISSLSSFSAEAASPHMFVNNHGKTIVNPGYKVIAGRRTNTNLGQNLGYNLAYNNASGNDHGQNVRSNSSASTNNSGGRNNPSGNEGYENRDNSPSQNPDRNSSNSPGGGNPGRNPDGNNQGNNKNNNNPSGNPKKEKTPSLSAIERLKIRSPSTPLPGANKVRSLVDLNNGKTPGRNLEDALNELEDMYKSLRLSDEDLLDRAERRDLPTPHQELRNTPLIPLPQHGAYRFESLGSVESLATGTGSSSGGSGTNFSSDNPNRVRAPPLRRSSRPDTVTDDMARRKSYKAESKPLDPRNVVAKTGSYMVFSPAFSPPASPCPPETFPYSISYGNHEDPDLTLDDVTFRNYKKANSIRIIDPQPPFGIPLGPITAAPGTDYLHSKKSDRLRPLFKATKNPDLVNDDIAFRNLRKDLNTDNNLSKDWTPRLFSPTRDNVFNYNTGHDQRDKKLRAIRSLSANVTNFIPFTEHSFNSSDIGKWNSFTDLHQRHNMSSPTQQSHQPQKRRASTYLQPSWVEQIEKVQTSTETLTENRNSNNKFASEPEHWERKLPTKTVQLTPELYDPTKPRRPWTDIILDSFEKEKQNEIEQIALEAASAAAVASSNADSNINTTANDNDTTTHNVDTMVTSKKLESHPGNNLEITEEDDDVFLDAREVLKSNSPKDCKPTSRTIYATPEVNMIQATVMDSEDEAEGLVSSFPLLLGQKTRRGSWVEPRSSSSYLSSSEIAEEEDRRRKSWSDLPKDLEDSFPPSKRLFTPLPPPRKIKQINLFSTSSTNATPTNTTPNTKVINKVNYLKERVEDKSKIVKIPSSQSKGEVELNELMDMLIREADTCGPTTMTNSEADANTTTTTAYVSCTSSSLSTNTQLSQNNKEEKEEEVKCSSKQRVKPSLSSELTQKDMLDGKRASLPKIPLEESLEPTKNKDKSLQDSDMTVAPEIVSVIRKPTSTKNFPSNTIEKIDKTKSCSIEELIDSINESLPELEASCTSQKSNESSLSSSNGNGSPPAIPSPRPGSPTTITFPIRSSSIAVSQRQQELQFPKESKCQNKESCDKSEKKIVQTSTSITTTTTTSTYDHHGNETMTRMDCEEKADEAVHDVDVLGDSNLVLGESMRKSFEESTSSNGTSGRGGPIPPLLSAKEGTFSSSTTAEMMVKKSPEDKSRRTKAQSLQDSVKESSPGYGNGIKGSFPFLRNSTSRSRSQSIIGSLSTSPTTGSELGESKKEKDKSHKRKSHLNRAFTEEPVPESTSSYHLSPHHAFNHEPNKVESSNNNSEELLYKKSLNSIYKVPTIPSILTTNKDQSPVNTNLISSPFLPPSPMMKLKSGSGSIQSKMQSFESRKSSPVVKKDSFSDAEGVSFIKKLLQKESLAGEKALCDLKVKQQQEAQVQNKETGFQLKKSQSVGNNSYWSKFSNSQPAFLKKFFDKPEKPIKELSKTEETKSLTKEQLMPLPTEEEPVRGFSVAQKASFFMKLEHDQRFSRWRKNFLESPAPVSTVQHQSTVTVDSTPKNSHGSFKSKSSRQFTQPITITEVREAANIIISGESAPPVPPVRKLRTPMPQFIPSDNEINDTQEQGINDSIPSYEGCDENIGTNLEPSKLSLKDRVNMFDKLISTGTKAPSAASTPYPTTCGYNSGVGLPFPVNHSSSAIIPSSTPMSFYASNQISYNNFGLTTQNQLEGVASKENDNLNQGFFKRRGSTSDLEMSSTPKYSPVAPRRNSKTKSMFVSDDGSEDGEVSSGGQEVAEIISRSYENSPVARKKSWRTQQKQAQASFTKEIWRRCKVNENWNWKLNGDSQESSKKNNKPIYKTTTNVTHQVAMNYQGQNGNQGTPVQSQLEPISSETSPATSNLLQILTVLSSSNDELSESHPKPKKAYSTENFSGEETRTENNKSVSTSSTEYCTNSSVTHQVNVPNPNDESFQTFFSSRTSAFTNSSSLYLPHSELSHEMDLVQRESGMLVMKKNIPLLRRKSVGKSRNPLKALAARIDFHNQWYTDGKQNDNPDEKELF